jgi:signal transduction histidine kinase
MRGTARLDAVIAAGFTVAATTEAVLRFHDTPARLALNVVGALLLAPLALRRTRPVLALASIGAGAIVVALATHVAWPGATVEATVAVLAMMLATYSVGAHGGGRADVPLALGIPLVVVLATDVTTMSGWALASGVFFVSVFVGAVPTLVGRLVRTRSRNVEELRRRRDAIVREQTAQRETAVVAERLAVDERIRPALVAGLRRLAQDAANDAPAGEIEERARDLLARTRREVVALTAEVDPGPAPASRPPPTTEHGTFEPWWLVIVAVASTWAVTAVLVPSLGPLSGGLVEAGLALGTSFVVGLVLRGPTAVLGLLTCVTGHVLLTYVAGPSLSAGLEDLPGTVVVMVVSWAAGVLLRDLGLLVRELRATNEILAGQAEALAGRAVVGERMRLARDLHDVLGHTLTVVALQAGAARRIAATDPARAREVVAVLARVAQDGVLALDQNRPTSGIGELIERTRTAGLVVSADVVEESLLSDATRAVAYRLVQESLTNVLRHAPGAQASVVVGRRQDHVEVAVTNTAPTGSPESRGSGRGLAGIRERVTSCAGEVSWGHTAEGGFMVLARLPIAVQLT